MAYMTIIAQVVKDGKVIAEAPPLNIMRPSWDDVYNGYPLYNKGTPDEKDKDADTVFKEVIGNNYDTAIFKNACATRVSLALVKSRFEVKKDFLIQTGDFKGKGFIASAKGLKEWLSEPDVWGEADIVIKGKTTLEKVKNKINGRSGVYIISDSANGKKDHATLWVGANNDAIGGRNYVENGGTVYFWELKGFETTRMTTGTKTLLVREVDGRGEALPGEMITYEVLKYHKDNNIVTKKEVSENDKNRIKWAVMVDEEMDKLIDEDGKDVTGEKVNIKMKDEWVGKEIFVMPYLYKPTKDVSVKTVVSKKLLIVITGDGIKLFTLDGTKDDLSGEITVRTLYYDKKLQWFEPTADRYIPLVSIEPDIIKRRGLKHFSWADIVTFAEIKRLLLEYKSGFNGDWKKMKNGADGYILVTVGGVPYWADAIGQIPFAVNCFTHYLEKHKDYHIAEQKTIEEGKKYGNGNIIGRERDDSESYDNKMILRAIRWASKRFVLKDGKLSKDTLQLPTELSKASSGEDIK